MVLIELAYDGRDGKLFVCAGIPDLNQRLILLRNLAGMGDGLVVVCHNVLAALIEIAPGFGKRHAGIASVKDLAGKNVAISAGTTSELVLSMALKLNGMEKTDVNMVNMDASGKVTAFMTNQIDAISIESPYTDQIRGDMGEENVVTLASSQDFLPDAVFTNSWVTTQNFLEGNEDVVVRFLRAWLKGTQDRYDNMDETVQKVADYINTDYDTAHLVAEKTNWITNSELKTYAEDGSLYKWYDTVRDMFVDANLLDAQYAKVPAEDYVKFDYLLQAMEDNGVE